MNNLKLKKNKKIIFVSHNLNPEGATWSLFFLAKGLKNHGYEVSVISPHGGPLLGEFKNEGIDVLVENCYSEHFLFEKYVADVFFVNTILGYRFIKNVNLNKNKVVWCIRESEREVYFNKCKDLSASIFKKVSSVVFVAESTREIYSDLGDKNFTTIHNGLDLEKVDAFSRNTSRVELRKKFGFLKTDIIFNLTGTVCLRKGQFEFVQSAIRVLDETKNSNLKFILVGGRPSPYELHIREIIKESNYEKNIIIIEETPEVYKYLLLSDYFVCNSYIESFPRVVLEAMAFRLPIIATNVYGISEQIEDNKEGALIMAGDTKDLSKKIKWFMEHDKEAEKYANEARKKIERCFSFEVMLSKYISLIENICVE